MATTTESESVNKVRERIISLAKEIEELSRSNLPPDQFFKEFLKRVVGAVGARAGAAWLRNGSAKLDLFSDCNLKSTGYFEKADAPALNQKLLDEVLSNGQACTHSPNDGSGVQTPTNDLIVLAALQQQKQCVGVVEIFQRVDTPAAARPGFLQFVEQMCGYACRYLERQATPKPTAEVKQKVTEQFEEFLLQLHRSLEVDEVSATAANDGRLLLNCDRLSVAVQYGKKTVIKAISGQDSVHQRANLVKRMCAMANKVILMREPLTFTGKLDHLPPQITTPLADYIQESGSRMVIIWPLFESEALVTADEKGAKRLDKAKKPIGGLIIEQISESQPRSGLQEKVESLSDHVAEALSNSKLYNRLFLLPVWKFFGKTFSFMEGRGKLKAAAAVLAVAGVIAALCLVPWEYRVEGVGRLMPQLQKDTFAPSDGKVGEIFVKGGQKVEKGQPLLRVENEQLRQQMEQAKSSFFEKRETLEALKVQLDAVKGKGEKNEENQVEGKIAATEEEITGARKQITILNKRLAELTVYAEQPGTIASFEVERQLLNRPVKHGELLLEIKDESGPWWLQVEIDERRMGHLMKAVRGSQEPLEVEYILATNPEDLYIGKLSQELIEDKTNPALGKDRAVVRARVEIKREDLEGRRRIGAEVTAKIHCGKRSLGYVLFGDVVEFVQRYFWISWP